MRYAKQARSKNLPPYRGETGGACSSRDDCAVICFRFAFPRNRERVGEVEGWLLRDWPGASCWVFRFDRYIDNTVEILREDIDARGRNRSSRRERERGIEREFRRRDEDGDETTLLTRVIL